MITDKGNNQNIDSSEVEHTHHALTRFLWRSVRVPLYLVSVLGAAAVLLLGMEKAAEYSLRKSRLGEIYHLDFPRVKSDYTRPVPHYDYDFVPGICLVDDRLKGNRYEYANNAGFREPQDISPEKPDDEYRILLTGGSTAFGFGNTGKAYDAVGPYTIEYRETVSHVLEKILNSSAPIPGKRVRVYNAAVWGYSYQHNVMRYLAKLRRFKPDLLISIDGANEIGAVSKLSPDWSYFKEGQYNDILRQMFRYDKPGLASYLTLWLKNNTYLMSWLWHGRDAFEDIGRQLQRDTEKAGRTRRSTPPNLSREETARMLDENVAAVVRVVENYHSVLENDQVPHLFVLQPWFYLSKKPLHEKEKILAGIQQDKYYYGVPSDQMYRLLVHRIIESASRKGYFVVDFSQYFDDVSEWVFTDSCHLTAGANYLMAKELAGVIKQHVLTRGLTPGDMVDDKNSYFWDLAYTAKVRSAPDPASPATPPGNMLRGFPGEELYASKPAAEKEKLEVVLDFQRPYPVSRLRIVWGDESSVPQSWRVEVSANEENWQLFAEGDKTQTNNYSRWPGYEHYRTDPLQARFFKYTQSDNRLRDIKLRCLSVQR